MKIERGHKKMIKFELETPQPGVVFYGSRQSGTTAVILNIQVDAGVKEVRFTGIKGCSRKGRVGC